MQLLVLLMMVSICCWSSLLCQGTDSFEPGAIAQYSTGMNAQTGIELTRIRAARRRCGKTTGRWRLEMEHAAQPAGGGSARSVRLRLRHREFRSLRLDALVVNE